jgi:hypothetical protein
MFKIWIPNRAPDPKIEEKEENFFLNVFKRWMFSKN